MVSSFVSAMDNHRLCSGQLGGIWRLRHERMWGRSDYCSHFVITIMIRTIYYSSKSPSQAVTMDPIADPMEPGALPDSLFAWKPGLSERRRRICSFAD